MSSEKIVMIDDDDAAQPYTMEGWKSRTGYFYADESLARYEGCTHRPCGQCGAPAEKAYTKCLTCREDAAKKRFLARPQANLDGEDWLYSEREDRFYPDLESAEDDLEEGETLEDLRLIICEPVTARALDSEYFEDELPEDEEIPEVIEAAIMAFNKAVKDVILSWRPGRNRLRLPDKKEG